jgi:NhaP-type Na+/H+ or K+/H+ antiporter
MVVFIFVVRPLTVLACLLPDRRGRWTRNELIFLSWCRETGVIPAALAALLLSQNVLGAEIAVSLVARRLRHVALAGHNSRPASPPPRAGGRELSC